MVLAHHLIWVAYGWWLPNDPRGSTSRTIRNDVLSELGELPYGRKRVQPASRDIRAFYAEAQQFLRHELLTFSPHDVGMIAQAFKEVIADERYTCYACAVMPDHVHLVIRKHRDHAEEMISKFQWASKEAVHLLRDHDPNHPVWGGPGWKVFLDETAEIERTIRYVEDNPVKARMPRQEWEFITAYDGWPFHKRRR
ncbi:MAG: Transposase [Phycisphaerales bacterium]|nr:Transposase [Phycisphaerales bacterium]